MQENPTHRAHNAQNMKAQNSVCSPRGVIQGPCYNMQKTNSISFLIMYFYTRRAQDLCGERIASFFTFSVPGMDCRYSVACF